MITTVHGPRTDPASGVFADQAEILKDILTLYVRPLGTDRFELDATFGKGNFYFETGIPHPTHRFDLCPRFLDVEEADARHLPLKDGSVKSAVFDPPFIHAHGKESVIGKSFASYKSQVLLHEMYRDALVEHYRVLAKNGILVFKCMDVVESGTQVWSHINVYQMASEVGFAMEDLFILTAGHRMIGHNHHEQKHARKYHSYFLVFRKGGRRHKLQC